MNPATAPNNNGSGRKKAWIAAARPRTLPLALSSILLGSFLAASHGGFRWAVFLLCVLTTICLQILSNLANDYGDSIHGADSLDRQGPVRAVQSGEISLKEMKNAVILFSCLSLVFGLILLWVALNGQGLIILGFLALGLLCIYAAVTYTNGKNPYGYAGFGDISVFLFFGVVGVCGTFYLHTGTFNYLLLLPAAACGLLSTGVLNINNIRDIESDEKAGKRSIPVRIGGTAARFYHLMLLLGSLVLSALYVYLTYRDWQQYVFLIVSPLFALNAFLVFTRQDAKKLDPLLKQMALSTLLFVLVFGLGDLITSGLPPVEIPDQPKQSASSPPSRQIHAPEPNWR